MSNLTKLTKAQLIDLVGELTEEIKASKKKVKREEKTLPTDSEFIALSYLQDKNTQEVFVYELEFDPTSANIINKHRYYRQPHMAQFKAKEILHERLFVQTLKGVNND